MQAKGYDRHWSSTSSVAPKLVAGQGKQEWDNASLCARRRISVTERAMRATTKATELQK